MGVIEVARIMKSLFSIFKSGLQKTKTTLVRRIQAIFTGQKEWTAETYVELEAALIQADLGVATATRLVDDLRERYSRGLVGTADDIMQMAATDLQRLLDSGDRAGIRYAATGPTVIIIAGVNGSGKTTTTAKLAHLWQQDGKSVLLAACDTFRAAAVEQLRLWGERLKCPVVSGNDGADAAAVAFDAVTAGRKQHIDIVLLDTAGRQHTRKSLMDELAKIGRIAGKACPGAPHEVWLTLDASIGSNAVTQAREFSRMLPLTGLIVTKLDGTGKGGSVVAIRQELHLPVHFIGLGEQMEDLQPFNARYFSRAILGLEAE